MLRPALYVLMLVLCAPLWGAGERLPVWQVKTEQTQLVILGSVHMAYPDIYPLRPQIETAFDESDVLVVEIDVSGGRSLEIQQLMMQKGRLQSGENLQQYLSSETWDTLQAYLSDHELAPAVFAQLHPALVAMMLSSMRMMDLGMRPELGLDQHFLERARGTKKVWELETAEQQLDLLLNFPDNNLLMAQTLDELLNLEQAMDSLYGAWKAGDTVELNRLLLDEPRRKPGFQVVYERLFTQRNIKMAEKITQMLDTPGKFFVVVGAGHLLGEQGIISLLQHAGYQPQRL